MISLRLGLTTRVTNSPSYFEPRDALAHDWQRFMAEVLPEAYWMPLPNVGEAIVDFVQGWGLSGIVLTGGNDIGQSHERDLTENTLLAFAMENRIPVFGVCRGLQMIAHYFGHDCIRCQGHCDAFHEVNVGPVGGLDPGSIEVNSYHNFCIADFKSKQMVAFAHCPDGNVEGIIGVDSPLMGVMWHPERENPCSDYSKELFRKFFQGGIKQSEV